MNWRQRVLVGTGLALVTGLIGLGLGRVSFFRGVEWKLYDLRMRETVDPANAPRNIAIVTIDEDSIRDFEPLVGRWPWPRVMHARLLDYLARAPARLVVYDVLFLEHDRQQSIDIGGVKMSGPESDQELVDATAKAGNVIYAGDASVTPEVPGEADDSAGAKDGASGAAAVYRLNEALEEGPAVTPPFQELAAAALGIGHSVMVLDEDGPLRRVVPFLRAAPPAGQTTGTVAGCSISRCRGVSRGVEDRTRACAGRRRGLDAEARPSRAAVAALRGAAVRE
jgi:adenylate cyclase